MNAKENVSLQGLDLHELAQRFSVKYKFDQVVGCVDGTHIPLQKPTRNEGAYVCRKGYHSLNVMVIISGFSQNRYFHTLKIF